MDKENGDWYQTRTLCRHFILKIVYIIDDMLRNSIKISSRIFRCRLCHLQQCFKLQGFQEIFNADWQRLKDPIRIMENKYCAEEDHSKYKLFYQESVKLWMQLQKDIEC